MTCTQACSRHSHPEQHRPRLHPRTARGACPSCPYLPQRQGLPPASSSSSSLLLLLLLRRRLQASLPTSKRVGGQGGRARALDTHGQGRGHSLRTQKSLTPPLDGGLVPQLAQKSCLFPRGQRKQLGPCTAGSPGAQGTTGLPASQTGSSCDSRSGYRGVARPRLSAGRGAVRAWTAARVTGTPGFEGAQCPP